MNETSEIPAARSAADTPHAAITSTSCTEAIASDPNTQPLSSRGSRTWRRRRRTIAIPECDRRLRHGPRDRIGDGATLSSSHLVNATAAVELGLGARRSVACRSYLSPAIARHL